VRNSCRKNDHGGNRQELALPILERLKPEARSAQVAKEINRLLASGDLFLAALSAFWILAPVY
jgi:hypothetical protein